MNVGKTNKKVRVAAMADLHYTKTSHGTMVPLFEEVGEKADVLRRFGSDWRLLLNHLILFGFVYPSERSRIPDWVIRKLFRQRAPRRENQGVGSVLRHCNRGPSAWIDHISVVYVQT